MIQLLLSESSHICGGLGYHRLLVAAIDCVWCCVVGSMINEDEFIQKQGVFALLDLIEVSFLTSGSTPRYSLVQIDES